MADSIAFNEGRVQVEDGGWPATVSFALSTDAVADMAATDTYAGGFNEVAGTGYVRATQAEPGATGLGSKVFTEESWATGAATDWTSPKSIIALDDTTDKIIQAWNLVAGGAARDMSQANTTLNVTPTYGPTNPA